LTVDYWPH